MRRKWRIWGWEKTKIEDKIINSLCHQATKFFIYTLIFNFIYLFIYFFVFTCLHKKEREIQTSDLRFFKCGLSQLCYFLETSFFLFSPSITPPSIIFLSFYFIHLLSPTTKQFPSNAIQKYSMRTLSAKGGGLLI